MLIKNAAIAATITPNELTTATSSFSKSFKREIIQPSSTVQVSVPATLENAQYLLKQGNIESARWMLRDMLKKNPQVPEVILLMGRTYLHEDLHKVRISAMAALEIEKKTENAAALNLLNQAYQLARKQALTTEQKINLAKNEIADYHIILQDRPHWAQAIYATATTRLALYHLQNNVDDSPLNTVAEEFKRVVQLLQAQYAEEQYIADAYNQLGKTHRYHAQYWLKNGQSKPAREKYQQALKSFQLALSVDPNWVDALIEIAMMLRSQKQTEQAIKTIKEALPRLNNNAAQARAYEVLAALYNETGQVNKAVQSYRSGLQREPKLLAAYLSVAKLYLSQNDPSTAEKYIHESIRIEPNFIRAYLMLGQLYLFNNRVDTAVNTYNTALHIPLHRAVVTGTNNTYAKKRQLYYLLSLAMAKLYLYQKQEPETSLKWTQHAIQYQAATASLYSIEAWALHKSAHSKEAILLLQQAIEQYPTLPVLHYHLAAIYFDQKTFTSALLHANKALQTESTFSERDSAIHLKKKIQQQM